MPPTARRSACYARHDEAGLSPPPSRPTASASSPRRRTTPRGCGMPTANGAPIGAAMSMWIQIRRLLARRQARRHRLTTTPHGCGMPTGQQIAIMRGHGKEVRAPPSRRWKARRHRLVGQHRAAVACRYRPTDRRPARPRRCGLSAAFSPDGCASSPPSDDTRVWDGDRRGRRARHDRSERRLLAGRTSHRSTRPHGWDGYGLRSPLRGHDWVRAASRPTEACHRLVGQHRALTTGGSERRFLAKRKTRRYRFKRQHCAAVGCRRSSQRRSLCDRMCLASGLRLNPYRT